MAMLLCTYKAAQAAAIMPFISQMNKEAEKSAHLLKK